MYVRLFVCCMHRRSADSIATCHPVGTANKIGGIVWREATVTALHCVTG
jgi:hypothetical protein